MALLYKKGEPSNCGNYRPISLLCVGYKLLASIILRRLKKGGAESRIWNTQFGFKFNSGTWDALFLLRRALDDVWAEKDVSVVRRFGLPPSYLNFIKNRIWKPSLLCERHGYNIEVLRSI